MKADIGSRGSCGGSGILGRRTMAAGPSPSQTTKYTYYTIGGDTAVEIYNSMMQQGPQGERRQGLCSHLRHHHAGRQAAAGLILPRCRTTG